MSAGSAALALVRRADVERNASTHYVSPRTHTPSRLRRPRQLGVPLLGRRRGPGRARPPNYPRDGESHRGFSRAISGGLRGGGASPPRRERGAQDAFLSRLGKPRQKRGLCGGDKFVRHRTLAQDWTEVGLRFWVGGARGGGWRRGCGALEGIQIRGPKPRVIAHGDKTPAIPYADPIKDVSLLYLIHLPVSTYC